METFWHIMLLITTLLVMLFGLLGSLLPAIPGLPIIWGASLVYAIITGFEQITETYLVIFGLLTAFVLVMDYVAGIYGAKKMGASRWGIIGAIIGMVLGVIVGTLPGLIIGPLIGAVAFEVLAGREFKHAVKAGFGTFLGFMAGTLMKVILSVIMIAVFLWALIF